MTQQLQHSKRKVRWLLALLLCSLSGCALTKCIVTNEQTDRPFNSLGRAVHLDLNHDGYVIAVEKRYWEEIGNPAKHYAERFTPLPSDSDDHKKQNARFKSVTNDTKAMVITHIASFFEGRQFLYNAYNEYGHDKANYETGYHGLDSFQKDLLNRLKSARNSQLPYTHVFILAMGWNNDQHKSIWRYNQMITHLKEEANNQGISFHPLVITLTWPSVWKGVSDSWFEKKVMGHAGSYFNKANDADEIGYTIANWILNKQLAEVKSSYGKDDFPFVTAIGHSFGARLLSRALDSPTHFKDDSLNEYTKTVDLFVGLQGAFSVNRFIKESGAEGSPYHDFKDWGTRVVLTSSNHDSAVPVARYASGASHVGGKFGLSLAEKHPDIFEVQKWDGEPPPRIPRDKVTVFNCDSIIKGDQAHNDVLDLEMAKLIWVCILHMQNE